MFKFIKFLLFGFLFGLGASKSEIISWYRIQEMFLFDNFHMYGVIGTAVVLGIIIVALIKRYKMKDFDGNEIKIQKKDPLVWSPLIGGSIFGLGWALTGACPGPIYVLIGQGYLSFLVVLASAILGTFTYGLLRSKLPH